MPELMSELAAFQRCIYNNYSAQEISNLPVVLISDGSRKATGTSREKITPSRLQLHLSAAGLEFGE